jgi:exosome complex RNA-binding protein Rrp4
MTLLTINKFIFSILIFVPFFFFFQSNLRLVHVPWNLIKLIPQHHVSLPFGIDLILGKNGMIWVSRSIPESWKEEEENITQVYIYQK